MMALWHPHDAEMSLGASLLHVISLFVSEPATLLVQWSRVFLLQILFP